MVWVIIKSKNTFDEVCFQASPGACSFSIAWRTASCCSRSISTNGARNMVRLDSFTPARPVRYTFCNPR
jgi:hypothetical protein